MLLIIATIYNYIIAQPGIPADAVIRAAEFNVKVKISPINLETLIGIILTIEEFRQGL